LTQVPKARAKARAWLSAVPLGAIAGATVGLALGGAYVAGDMAQDADATYRTAGVTAEDLSTETLTAMATEEPGLLAMALRYNPAVLAGYAALERESISVQRVRADHSFLKPRIGAGSNPAAKPYRANFDHPSEAECLTEAVYYEARGETPAGQAAVAQVVLNRARHPAYPKTICAVVYQGAQRRTGCQFSFACNGAMTASRETGAWRRAQRVALRALNGYVMPEVGNATHFHVTSVNPAWGSTLMQVGQVGAHIFYRFSGKRGRPATFQEAPAEETPPLIDVAPILASLTIIPVPSAPVQVQAATPPAQASAVQAAEAAQAPAPAPATTPAPATPGMKTETGAPAASPVA